MSWRAIAIPVLLTLPAFAGTLDDTGMGPSATASQEARAALRDRAGDVEMPPPALPLQASAQARQVHATIAFGRHGEIERDAHAEVARHARNAAGVSPDPHRGSEGAERNATMDGRNAAGIARATEARGGVAPGAERPRR